MVEALVSEAADMNGTRFTPILHYLRRLTGSVAVGGHTDEQLLSRFIAQRWGKGVRNLN